jgi:peptidoglycan hydrolase-like protein with peptidoglycan-binding domain
MIAVVSLAALVAATLTVLVLARPTPSAIAQPASHRSSATTATPVAVSSTVPADAATSVDGSLPLIVRLSGHPPEVQPTISPAVAGRWTRASYGWEFTPAGALSPGTQYTVNVPASGSFGGYSWNFTTALPSVTRLQQILAQLGYLPVAFTPASGSPTTEAAWQASVYHSVPGIFSWRWPGSMPQLQPRWEAGAFGPMTRGAIMQFEQQASITVDGKAGPQMWAALIYAAATGVTNQAGYTWTYVTKSPGPEQETVWHNGQIVLQTPVNTGIAQSPTADGEFDVYLRYRNQIMRGTNPDGTHYADPVSWVSYFNGGDALHYFNRASYGWPQSLGCVEEPYQAAETAWQYTGIGTLVTVAG